VEHDEVLKEEAAVQIVRTLKEWYGDRHLAVGHLWLPKEMDPEQWWVLGEVGHRAVPFLYGVSGTVMRDQTRTVLYKEPRKD
jgi:hypothetical protein